MVTAGSDGSFSARASDWTFETGGGACALLSATVAINSAAHRKNHGRILFVMTTSLTSALGKGADGVYSGSRSSAGGVWHSPVSRVVRSVSRIVGDCQRSATWRAAERHYIAVETGIGGGSPRGIPSALSPEIQVPNKGTRGYVFALPEK